MPNDMYCNACAKNIKKNNWDKHVLTKSHFSQMERVNRKLQPTKQPQPKDEQQKVEFSESTLEEMGKIQGVNILNKFSPAKNALTLHLRINEEVKTIYQYKDKLEEVLSKIENKHHKISLSVNVEFQKDSEKIIHGIQTPMKSINSNSQIQEILDSQLNYIKTQIEERYFQGSGLSFNRSLFCDIYIACYKRAKGGHHHKLPFKTKAIINVQSDDDKCFFVEFIGSFI